MDIIQNLLAAGIGLGHSVHVINELAGHEARASLVEMG
jgi:hypothetical protein